MTRFNVVLTRIRRLCADLPEVTERLSHGTPCFSIRDKKVFAYLWDDHHGDGRLALWCAAGAGVQEAMVAEEPDRFFRPPYVGHRGWLGVDLGRDPEWEEVGAILHDAYRVVAPVTVRRRLDALDQGGAGG